MELKPQFFETLEMIERLPSSTVKNIVDTQRQNLELKQDLKVMEEEFKVSKAANDALKQALEDAHRAHQL